LKTFRADLHVHTCLSPCADILMSPRRIADAAKSLSLDLLGVCDHNAADNAGAVAEAAARFGIRALPGMEVTSREEVHVLALFDEIESALRLQELVQPVLAGENQPEIFGLQVVADAEDEVLGFCPKLLAGAASLSLAEVVEAIHDLGGLAVAAHADREGFGLLGHLGFIPEDLPLDALEISPRLSRAEGRRLFGPERPLVASSDAHFLGDIGRSSTTFWLEAGTAAEIGLAFRGFGERRILE